MGEPALALAAPGLRSRVIESPEWVNRIQRNTKLDQQAHARAANSVNEMDSRRARAPFCP